MKNTFDKKAYDTRYQRENTTCVNLRLGKADADIVEHLRRIAEPKNTYIKRLIREDIETIKNKGEQKNEKN